MPTSTRTSWPGPASHNPLRRSGRDSWVVVPSLVFGFFTWLSFLILGLRSRRRDWILTAAAYGVDAALVFSTLGRPVVENDNTANALLGAALFLTWFGGALHAGFACYAFVRSPRPEGRRGWALNLAVPLLATALAFAGIVHAQGNAGHGGRLGPDHDCSTTLTNDTVGVLDSGVAVAPLSGDVLVSESRAGCVIRFGPDGVGHVIIGHGRRSGACPGCGVRVGRPGDLEVGADGTVYVVDLGEIEVVAVRPDGSTRVVAEADDAFDAYPRALARDSAGRIYVAETNRVYRLDPSGPVVLAGSGGDDVGSGAPATSVRLTRVSAIAVDPGGNLYIAEQSHYRVLRVDPAGAITVFAGTGLDGDSGDGGPATKANLNPDGLAADDAGNVYISVPFQHRIRRVDPAGQITTFAGRGRTGSTGDGGPAVQAAIGFPSDLAFRDGNLYILDAGLTPRIRKVDRAGIISTVAAGG